MNPFVKDEFGVTEYKGIPAVGTRKIAEIFDKEHRHVLDSVRLILDSKSGVKPEFTEAHFRLSEYKDSTGRKLPEYILTRDGFTLVAMGFTGKKAMQFKVAYIERFNQMESFIESLSAAKLEFPEFTRAILAAHEEPKTWHFSNEINMINRITLGMDAKHFKLVNGIDEKAPSIRPYLSLTQIKAVEALQKFDIGLIFTIPEYDERKQALTKYHNQLQERKLLG